MRNITKALQFFGSKRSLVRIQSRRPLLPQLIHIFRRTVKAKKDSFFGQSFSHLSSRPDTGIRKLFGDLIFHRPGNMRLNCFMCETTRSVSLSLAGQSFRCDFVVIAEM